MAQLFDPMLEPGTVIDEETGLPVPNMPVVRPAVEAIDAGLEAVAEATTPVAEPAPPLPEEIPQTIGRDGLPVGPMSSESDTGFRYPTSTTAQSRVQKTIEGPKTTVSQKQMTAGAADALQDMVSAEEALAEATRQQQEGLQTGAQVDIEKEQRKAALNSKYAEATADALAQEAQEVQMEMNRLDTKIQELANTPREEFWGSRSTSQKIAAALAVGLGSYGQALTGSGQNVGMLVLQSQIDGFNKAQDEKYNREIKAIEGMRANMATKRELAKTAREELLARKEAALFAVDQELAVRAGAAKTQQQVAQIAQQSAKIQADLANARASRESEYAQAVSTTREDKVLQNLTVKGLRKRDGTTWNESDKKTLNFYNRMAASQNEIEAIGGDEAELQIAKSPAYSDFMRQFQQNTTALKDMNFLGTNIGKVGSALSNMKSFQELKKNDPAAAAYVEAQIPFVMGRLRKDTGAAIAPTEFWETMNEFFPITNANEREIRNKISRRRDQLAGELDTLDVDIVE